MWAVFDEDVTKAENDMSDLVSKAVSFRDHHVPTKAFQYLSYYLLRLPIERFEDGIKIEHYLELFDRNRAQYSDPLLRKLQEADRLFFDLTRRGRRDEKRALEMYEELSNDLLEAKAMCLVIYNQQAVVGADMRKDSLVELTWKTGFMELELVESNYWTPVILTHAGFYEHSSLSGSYAMAIDLKKRYLPLHFNFDTMSMCRMCAVSLKDKEVVRCGFYQSPFCSFECQMHRWVESSFGLIDFQMPSFSDYRALAKKPTRVPEYLSFDDPTQIIQHFNILPLLDSEQRSDLEGITDAKDFELFLSCTNDALYMSVNEGKASVTDSIILLWCEAVLSYAKFRLHPREDCINRTLLDCSYLLRSGILDALEDRSSTQAREELSALIYLALETMEIV